MSHTSLTDAQIDARARAYARDHRVNYSEALDHVVAFAEPQAAAAGATNPSPAKTSPMTDAEADAAAKRYAAQHSVDYLTALQLVLQGQQGTARASHASESDQRTHAAAVAHALLKGVSYSEALDCVTIHQGAASFSEGAGPVADAAAVQALQSQPIEIFRAGSHLDDAGNPRTFSVADVKAMAAAYNPTRHEAPLTLGHPENNHPAYGWVKGLTATEDGRLLMQAGNVDPEFAAAVKAARYTKRSASFYPPLSPNNPAPGQWYLRHVAWLGAHPPAVKGLADVSFGAGGSDGAVCFDWV